MWQRECKYVLEKYPMKRCFFKEIRSFVKKKLSFDDLIKPTKI